MADQSDHSHSVTQLPKRSSRLHHHKETHGRSNDIDENTPLTHVKGPNMFERVKEEVEAVVQRVHSKKEKEEEEKEKAKAKEEASFQHNHRRNHHHKETHGGRDDIDETTSMDEVKGPNVFQRVKEEVEAIVETIHPKKGSSDAHK